MTNIIVAIDKEDEELGGFFEDCDLDLNNFFSEKNLSVNSLQNNQLNHIYIGVVTEPLDTFTFLAYSHGSDNELLSKGIPYIDEHNVESFKNSLFYTCSCHTGKLLGSQLIENGCLSYIGYKDKFIVWDFNRSPFIECANYAIKEIYSGVTSEQAINNAKEKYNEHIDNYNNDLIGAAMLRSNRDALIHLGKCIQV